MIERVVGNYRIIEKVGEGGMGTVYKAVDLMLEREVAIKAIRPELTREAEIVERFHAEAKMLARVSHPAIATIFSFFIDGGDLFLAMEFVRGVSLSRLLQRDGPMPWEHAIALLAGALDGIEQAHRAGIVHRDLKPDNLMITGNGAVKVMDFGIARLMGSGRLTRTGLLIGTLRYMAPEQIRGEEVDRRTDVYALGIVLYEMVTGRVPFDGSSDYAVLKAQIEEIPAPPSAALPALPAWLDQAILKALAKEPGQRFQTVDELRLFLLGQGLPIGATGPAMVISIGDQPTLVLAPTPRPMAKDSPESADALAPTTFRPAAQPNPSPAVAAAAQGKSDDDARSYREIDRGAIRRLARPLAAAMLLVIILGAAAVYWLQTPRTPQMPRTPAGQTAAAGAGRQGAAGSGAAGTPSAVNAAAGTTPNRGAAPPTATAPGSATRGGPAGGPVPPPVAGAQRGGALPDGAAGAGGTRSDSGAARPGSTGAAKPALRARSRPAGTAASTKANAGAGEDAARQEQPAGAGSANPKSNTGPAGGGSGGSAGGGANGASGASDAGNDERLGGLPASELRQLAVELQRKSEYLRNVYETALAQKARAGGRPSADEERLGAELKEFRTAAERFSQAFETGFFSRTRARLGLLTSGEDERSRVVRLARALTGSSATVDGLMRGAPPDEAVRRLWSEIRRQTMRVAEICGG